MTNAGNSSTRRRSVRRVRNGVLLLPVSGPEAVVTLETVNALRDELAVTHTEKEAMHIVGSGT